MKQNFLFVCGRNKWRSPTAENIYRNDQRINVRSAGISSQSNRKLNEKDIDWANHIFVMESDQKTWILSKFRQKKLPPIYILEIPDDFEFMNPELIELIKTAVDPYIRELS